MRMVDGVGVQARYGARRALPRFSKANRLASIVRWLSQTRQRHIEANEGDLMAGLIRMSGDSRALSLREKVLPPPRPALPPLHGKTMCFASTVSETACAGAPEGLTGAGSQLHTGWTLGRVASMGRAWPQASGCAALFLCTRRTEHLSAAGSPWGDAPIPAKPCQEAAPSKQLRFTAECPAAALGCAVAHPTVDGNVENRQEPMQRKVGKRSAQPKSFYGHVHSRPGPRPGSRTRGQIPEPAPTGPTGRHNRVCLSHRTPAQPVAIFSQLYYLVSVSGRPAPPRGSGCPVT